MTKRPTPYEDVTTYCHIFTMPIVLPKRRYHKPVISKPSTKRLAWKLARHLAAQELLWGKGNHDLAGIFDLPTPHS